MFLIRHEDPGDSAAIRQVLELAFGQRMEADLVDATFISGLVSWPQRPLASVLSSMSRMTYLWSWNFVRVPWSDGVGSQSINLSSTLLETWERKVGWRILKIHDTESISCRNPSNSLRVK